MSFARKSLIVMILIAVLMNCSTVLAWERKDDDSVILKNEELEYFLKAERENRLLKEQIEFLKQKDDLQEREIQLKDWEINLERKRADFEYEQFRRERESREFESKQYQELLRVSHGTSWKEKVGLGGLLVIIGIILGLAL